MVEILELLSDIHISYQVVLSPQETALELLFHDFQLCVSSPGLSPEFKSCIFNCLINVFILNNFKLNTCKAKFFINMHQTLSAVVLCLRKSHYQYTEVSKKWWEWSLRVMDILSHVPMNLSISKDCMYC